MEKYFEKYWHGLPFWFYVHNLLLYLPSNEHGGGIWGGELLGELRKLQKGKKKWMKEVDVTFRVLNFAKSQGLQLRLFKIVERDF